VKTFFQIADLTVMRLERWLVPAVMLSTFIVQVMTLRPAVVIGEPYFIAKNIIEGIGFAYPYPGDTYPSITAYIPPLYVWILTGVLKLGGGLVAMQVLNFIMLQFANLFVHRIARRFASPFTAFVGFAALSFYAPLWLLASAIEPNMLNHLLISAMILLMFIIYREPMRRGVYLALGIVIALQILVRPDMLMGLPLLGLWLVWVLRKELDTTRLIKKISFLAATIVVLVGPWTLRNYIVFDKFIAVSANSGYNLFIGNNVGASGEFMISPDNLEEDKELKEIDYHAQLRSPLQRDQYYRDVAFAWVKSHPGEWLALTTKKVYFHWWRRAFSGSGLQITQWMIIYDIITFVLLALGLYGLVKLRDKNLRWLFIALFVYSTAVSAVFFVQSRHRGLKVDPYLVPLAAYGLSVILLGKNRVQTRHELVSRERLALTRN
jgi:4-amino-4-deoxy-L-arabinose transferase-like glycosyltransferase